MLKQPDEIRSAYSNPGTAEQYIGTRFVSAWGSVLHATQVRVVNNVIRAHGVKRVIELAPGPARISTDVSGFERGYLCEFNDAMLRVARRRLAARAHRWRLVRGDAFHLPFSQPVDMVYTFRFIRHFEEADRRALYQQVHSVLNAGGLFVFDAVNVKVGLPAARRDGLDAQHVYDEYYEPETLQQELVRHGFTPRSLTPVIRHMSWQQQIQVLVGPRSTALARRLIELLERLPGEPLEWVVVCQKSAAH